MNVDRCLEIEVRQQCRCFECGGVSCVEVLLLHHRPEQCNWYRSWNSGEENESSFNDKDFQELYLVICGPTHITATGEEEFALTSRINS